MQWIDGEDLTVGTIGFLVETTYSRNGVSTRYGLYQRPCHTNRSNAPRLVGWCGETDNVSWTACGLGRVAKITSNGRAQVVPVVGVAGRDWLTEIAGYPDLVPDDWR